MTRLYEIWNGEHYLGALKADLTTPGSEIYGKIVRKHPADTWDTWEVVGTVGDKTLNLWSDDLEKALLDLWGTRPSHWTTAIRELEIVNYLTQPR